MPSSEAEAPNTPTITEAPTTRVTAKGEFVSARDTEFSINVLPNGLFCVKMLRGGVAPPICDELFTARSTAEIALSRYLKSNDRLGYAKVPTGKAKNAKS